MKDKIKQRVLEQIGSHLSVSVEGLEEVVETVINQVVNYCENEQEIKHLEGVLKAVKNGEGQYLKDAKRFVQIHTFLKNHNLDINELAELDIEQFKTEKARSIALFINKRPEIIDSVKRIYRQGALQELSDDKLKILLANKELNLAQKELLEREQHRRMEGTAFDGASAYEDLLDISFHGFSRPIPFALAEKITDITVNEVYENIYPDLKRDIAPAKQELEAGHSEHSL